MLRCSQFAVFEGIITLLDYVDTGVGVSRVTCSS